MEQENKKYNSAVRRMDTENYILISLIAFVTTVIVTRVFLHVSGYPQIGNDVLHIAHALWGGILLIVAVYFPLIYANRWAFYVSALLSGIGIGLFIDEIGKFITQANDYFFPPALSLIYGFILLNVFVYYQFRRPRKEDPRDSMYHALDWLKEFIDGGLDTNEAALMNAQLTKAKQSGREDIVNLANAISSFIQGELDDLPAGQPGALKRITLWLDTNGQRIGRRLHRNIISLVLILWVAFVIGYILILIQGGTNIDPKILQWRFPLIGFQALVGILMIVAIISWFSKNENRGLKFATSGILLSLVALQTFYFYISQISAITATLIQFLIVQVLFTYRRWYMGKNSDRP